MNKIITTLLLLTAVRCPAMDVETLDLGPPVFHSMATSLLFDDEEVVVEDEEVVETAVNYKRVVQQAVLFIKSKERDIGKVYHCLVSLDRVLEQLLEEGYEVMPHEKEAIVADEHKKKVLDVRYLLHDLRILWVKNLVALEVIDERNIGFCLKYLDDWATRLQDNVDNEPILVLTSCVEVLDALIQGCKKFLEEFGTVRKIELVWNGYLERQRHVDQACLDQLQAVRDEVVRYKRQCENLLRLDGDDCIFQVALDMKVCIVDKALGYLESKQESDVEVLGAIPDAEEHIKSILMNDEEVIDSLTITVAEWKQQLIEKRDALRRDWANLLFRKTVSSKEKKRCRDYNGQLNRCIDSYGLLKEECVIDQEGSKQAVDSYQRTIDKLDLKIAKAKELITHAKQRVKEAAADRNSVISRIENRAPIDQREEEVRPVKNIVRARDKGNEEVAEKQKAIKENNALILKLMAQNCTLRKEVVTLLLPNEVIAGVHTDRLNYFYARLHEVMEKVLKQDVCRVFRDKEGIKDDYTGQESISLDHHQLAMIELERLRDVLFDEEKILLAQLERRKQEYEEKMSEAERWRKERKDTVKLAEDVQRSLRRKIKNLEDKCIFA